MPIEGWKWFYWLHYNPISANFTNNAIFTLVPCSWYEIIYKKKNSGRDILMFAGR